MSPLILTPRQIIWLVGMWALVAIGEAWAVYNYAGKRWYYIGYAYGQWGEPHHRAWSNEPFDLEKYNRDGHRHE